MPINRQGAEILRERLQPRGLWAFVRCAFAQHRAFGNWRESIRVAWAYGPVR